MGAWIGENLVGLLGVLGSLTIALVALFRFRTERHREKATVRGESAIQTLELLYDAIAVVNASGCIIEANQQMRLITGYTDVELIGMLVNDLIPPRFRKVHANHMRHYATSPYPRMMGKSGMKLYLLDKAGVEKRVQISLRPKEGTDGPETILCLKTMDDSDHPPQNAE